MLIHSPCEGSHKLSLYIITDRVGCTPAPPKRDHLAGGGSQEGVSMKSQRIALALALLATLDNSVALKGWHGSARLRAYVARAVADLLA